MREIQAPPKSSEELKQRKEMEKWAAREKIKAERNLEKDKLNLKNNKRLLEHKKKEQKSSIKLEAELLRKNAAHGELMILGAEDPRENFYFKDTPLNVCNICKRILDSKNGKKRHVKDISSHGVYQTPCTSKDRCGGLFLNESDLAIHKEITGH